SWSDERLSPRGEGRLPLAVLRVAVACCGAIRALAVLVGVVFNGDGVGAAQPAGEVDVSTAARAERAGRLLGGCAADRALAGGLRVAVVRSGTGHALCRASLGIGLAQLQPVEVDREALGQQHADRFRER